MSRVKENLSIFLTGIILNIISMLFDNKGYWFYLSSIGWALLFYCTVVAAISPYKKDETPPKNNSDILKIGNLIIFGSSGILVAASFFFPSIKYIYAIGLTGLIGSSIVAIVFIRDHLDTTKPKEGE